MQVIDEGNWPERSLAYLCRAFDQLDKEKKEQKKSKLYYWAQLFKAETLEEMWMLAEKDETIRECVFTYKDLSEDEKARMQSEARDDYYRRLNGAEKRGIRKGMEKGLERAQKEIARNLLSNVEHAMESFHVDLKRACEGLGTTVDAYQAAKELLE